MWFLPKTGVNINLLLNTHKHSSSFMGCAFLMARWVFRYIIMSVCLSYGHSLHRRRFTLGRRGQSLQCRYTLSGLITRVTKYGFTVMYEYMNKQTHSYWKTLRILQVLKVGKVTKRFSDPKCMREGEIQKGKVGQTNSCYI